MAASEGAKDNLEGLPAAYAAWRASPLGRVTDTLEQDLILGLIGPPAGRRILDVGCGDGILAVQLAASGACVTGVDASPDMIAAARKRALREKQDIVFEVAEAQALPFAAGTFDTVVTVAVLCFIEDAGASLRELARVLQPGGQLIIGDLGKWSLWAATRRVKGWLGSPVWRRARFRTASELRALACKAGLPDASVTGAVFYPPGGIAARLMAPIDRRIGTFTTVGAAFLALTATKSQLGPEKKEAGFEHP